MFPKGPQLRLCLFLVFFMTTALVPWSEGKSYDDFLKRHLDNPKSDYQNDCSYCNVMMRRRDLTCQRGNTFIHATKQQLTSICNSKGTMLNGNQTSKTLFPITICTKRQGIKRVLCKYKGEVKITKIRVTCKKGFPVHYIASV